MKHILLSSIFAICTLFSCKSQDTSKYQNGDIIFQVSQSSQCKAVQLATHSKYSHCGMLYLKDDKWFVAEAVEPVKLTPLNEFISHGKDGHFVVKRVKSISKEQWTAKGSIVKDYVSANLGKHYDLYFNWDDSKIYCSELVWKAYKKAFDIEIGKLQTMKDFDLTHPAVKSKLKERYGNNIPLNEQVISPAQIFDSNLLSIVDEN